MNKVKQGSKNIHDYALELYKAADLYDTFSEYEAGVSKFREVMNDSLRRLITNLEESLDINTFIRKSIQIESNIGLSNSRKKRTLQCIQGCGILKVKEGDHTIMERIGKDSGIHGRTGITSDKDRQREESNRIIRRLGNAFTVTRLDI